MFAVAPEKFLGAILLKLKPIVALPDTYIIRKGEFGEEMYFISRGEVAVVVPNGQGGEIQVAKLGSGKFFGEMAVMFGQQRMASIKANTYCDLFMLTKADFEEVMEEYPRESEPIKREARARMNMPPPTPKRKLRKKKEAAAAGTTSGGTASAEANKPVSNSRRGSASSAGRAGRRSSVAPPPPPMPLPSRLSIGTISKPETSPRDDEDNLSVAAARQNNRVPTPVIVAASQSSTSSSPRSGVAAAVAPAPPSTPQAMPGAVVEEINDDEET